MAGSAYSGCNMNAPLLQSRSEGGVVTLCLHRPQVHNAFDDELIAALSRCLLDLERDKEVKAVVLTGQGRSFSAGADLNWMQSMISAGKEENKADALRLAKLLRILNYLNKPTIAKINGPAYGGGVGLIACCDIAMASDQAQFGLTEVRLGLAPAVISPYVFRKIGEHQARRYFISGERFSAARAKAIGLIHEVANEAELDQAVSKQLELLLQAGPAAVKYCKQLSFAIAGHNAASQEKLDEKTASLIAELRVSEEGQEGLRSFLEKRQPEWRKLV